MSSFARSPGRRRTSAAWMFFARPWRRPGIRFCRLSNASGGTGAADERRAMAATEKRALTTPDMVLLSLLAERPMHGYEANAELERRCIRDWAAISRPQVYYSLEKLAAAGFIRKTDSSEPASGPERA